MRTTRRRWATVAVAAIVFVNVLALAGGIFLQHAATRLSYDPTKSYAQSFGVTDHELARWFRAERFEGLTKEPVRLPSDYGYPIRGLFIHSPGPPRGTVLISGYAYAVMPVGDVFLDRGFNVLTYYGRTGKTTYGYHEKYDLEKLVRFARRRDPVGTVGVYASSANAASALQHAAMNRATSDVAFYIIDCAFSDLPDLLRYHLRQRFGFPPDPLVSRYASLVNYLRDGYFFGEVSPRRSIAGVRTPMLFIHGRADTMIPNWMTEELYKAKAGAKLLLTHDGGHGLVAATGGGPWVENREAFVRKVDELLAVAATGGG